MNQGDVANPFTDEELEQVPLNQSPLETVIFQLRFPEALSKLKRSLVNEDLQNELADAFPYAERQQTVVMGLKPGSLAPTPEPGPDVWNLRSADRRTTASFSGNSVSLVTSAYVSRASFLEQVRSVLSVVQEVASPPPASRIGLRYIDRVLMNEGTSEDWVKKLTSGAQGVLGSMEDGGMDQAKLFVQHLLYGWDDGTQMQGRWGILPSGAILDEMMAVRDARTWFLDIDTFVESSTEFDLDAISKIIETLARRSYRFFRWMVPPAALAEFSPESPK